MKSMLALVRREYLEHRAAFLYVPVGILVVLTVTLLSALAMQRVRPPIEIGEHSLLGLFQVSLYGMSALWFLYLMAALFFYYADAFSADRRNNAMFFWKSMPVTDFKILSAKMLTGMTLFPALIFCALLLTSVLLYVLSAFGGALLGLGAPDPVASLTATLNIAWLAFVHLALALLWYAPFFAWVGGLSAVFRRWSIPLAFLIPALVGLMENILLNDSGPRGGYVLDYLRRRLAFGADHDDFESKFFFDTAIDTGLVLNALLAGIDWAQMGSGLIIAALIVYAASEYRRRVIST